MQRRWKWRRLGLMQGRRNYPRKAEPGHRRKTWGLRWKSRWTSIEVLDDRVAFPWFSQVDADSAAAYTHFISALCEMSRNAKRVTATEKPVDNEKYAFRCFLLRLGFIGSEYKAERKILLKNLTGSSAFKNGGVGHEVSE